MGDHDSAESNAPKGALTSLDSDEGSVPPNAFGDSGENPDSGSSEEGLLKKITGAFRGMRKRKITHLDDDAVVKRAGIVQDQTLRKWYARLLLVGMAAQLGFANVIFWRYSTAWEWKMPAEVVVAWLSGTVVEVIGLVVIVTRYLFPTPKE